MSTPTSPDPTAVAHEVERIALSNSFRKAERCLRLLRHLTSLALAGRSGELREYSLGITVFERPASYDPGADPVVRLEARRLRLKLAEYYQQEGIDDPVIIDVPKGAYVPEFRFRRAPEVEVEPPPAQSPRSHRSPPIWLAAALLLIPVSVAGWAILRKQAPVLQVRASIAVLGFRNLSSQNESSWISAAVSELMNIGLGADQRLRTTPLENVARMRTELSLTPQSAYSAQLLQRIRVNLGSDYVVAGSYLLRENRVHLDVMLFDARSGRQLAAISEEGAEDNLPELTRECVRRVQAQLGVRLPGNGYSSFEADAMEPYARGMERLRQGDALSARAYLETAAAAEPSNPLIHSGLAAAWSGLGLDIRAAQEAKLAFDASGWLGRVEQLEIEGRYRTMAHDWPRAIQVYQALFTLLPDDLEYGLLLASAETRGGKAQDALGTVKVLRRLPSPPGDDPRIDLAEAQAAGALSDFARTRQAAGSAAKKAQAHGARLQYAKARLLESGAMQTLALAGFPQVRAEARQICAELGDRACVAAAYRIEANQMIALVNLGAARRLYGEALEIANQIGNDNEKLNALTGLAYAAKLRGDLPAAEGDYRKALAVGSEMGPQKSYPVSLDLADVLADEGRLAEARTLIGQALQVSQQVGDRQGVGLSHAALAHILGWEGKASEALGEYNEAVGILREVNGPYELLETLLEVGKTQLEQGDFVGARKSFDETRSLTHKVPGWFQTPEIEMALARLGFSEGRFADAAQHARLALSGFTAAGWEGDRFAAAAVLTRALIAQGRIAEASEVLAQVPSPDIKKLPAESVLQFEIARCFVMANTGRREEADRAMDVLSANASRSGLPKLASEALQAKKALATPALAKTAM
ncbi:MAG: hypothetical protein ACLQU1_37690 [Bryobacteraceae bacterium]